MSVNFGMVLQIPRYVTFFPREFGRSLLLFLDSVVFYCIQFLPREATRSAVLSWHVVRPSVTLRYRDHIRSNSAKIISQLISLTISLSADPT